MQAERDAKEEARETQRLALMSSMMKPDGPSSYDQWKEDNPEPEPYKPDSSGSGSSSGSSSSSTSSAQSVAAGKGSAGKGGRYSQADLTSFAEQAGFSPEQARIMGAIGMGESGGNAGIDTVQSGLDPNRSNEYSVGLFQINAQAHGDKLSKLGYTSCLLYTSPSPRDRTRSRMPSSA